MSKYFACICSPEGEKECEEELAQAMKDLNATPENFLSKIVYSLQWALPNEAVGSITGIGCDMWAGISFSVQHMDGETKKYKEGQKFFVQCDEIEHGLAKVWKLAVEYAEESEYKLEFDEPS